MSIDIFPDHGIYYSCDWVKFWQDWQLSPDKHQEPPHLEGTSQMETWLINTGKLAMSHLVRGGAYKHLSGREKLEKGGRLIIHVCFVSVALGPVNSKNI